MRADRLGMHAWKELEYIESEWGVTKVVVGLLDNVLCGKSAKSRQHPDFPGGHPPEYYPSLRLLNFTERTGYGVLSLRWPSTLILCFPTLLIHVLAR